jgi:hypothetical protein
MGPLNYSWLAARCLGYSQRRNLSGWSAAGLGERRLDAAEKYARAAAATGQLAVSEDECRDVLSATLTAPCGTGWWLNAAGRTSASRPGAASCGFPPW